MREEYSCERYERSREKMKHDARVAAEPFCRWSARRPFAEHRACCNSQQEVARCQEGGSSHTSAIAFASPRRSSSLNRSSSCGRAMTNRKRGIFTCVPQAFGSQASPGSARGINEGQEEKPSIGVPAIDARLAGVPPVQGSSSTGQGAYEARTCSAFLVLKRMRTSL